MKSTCKIEELLEQLVNKLSEHRLNKGAENAKPYPQDIKKMCIYLLDKGMSKRELAKKTGLHSTCFNNWKELFTKKDEKSVVVKELTIIPDNIIKNRDISSNKTVKIVLPSKAKVYIPIEIAKDYLDKIFCCLGKE